MPGNSKIPVGGDFQSSDNKYSDVEWKKQISQKIAIEAMKASQTANGKIEGQENVEFEEEKVILVDKPQPTGLSEIVTRKDEKRKHFIYRLISNFGKKIEGAINYLKDSKAGVGLFNFVSNLGKREKLTPLTFGKHIIKGMLERLDQMEAHKQEGLFRVPGRIAVRNKYIEGFKKQNLDLENLSKRYQLSQEDMASGLKAILKELALFEGVKEQFLEIGDNTVQTDEEKILKFQVLMDQLDPQSKEILKMFLDYLGKVVENSKINKMPPENLSTCIAVNFYKEETNQQKALRDQTLANAAFYFLLIHKDQIL
jgi:hypothetical protein